MEKVAKTLKKHPATIYRWIESYNCSGHLSELLRKNRADRGKSRLSSKVDTIIEDAIKKIYLTAEQPHISAVMEKVNLQCFKAGLKKPAANTVRRRIATLSDRLKLEGMEEGSKGVSQAGSYYFGSPRVGVSLSSVPMWIRIRAVIIEDEPLAAEYLAALLDDTCQVEPAFA